MLDFLCRLAMLGCAVSSSASINPLSDARMLFSKSVLDDIVLGAVRGTCGAVHDHLRHIEMEDDVSGARLCIG